MPHFLGIRIHSGNSSKDTEGCIILGTKSKGDWVTARRVAFNKVYKLLQEAVARKEEITITIR